MKKLVFLSAFCLLFSFVSLVAFGECCQDMKKSTLQRAPIESCENNEECHFLCLCIKKSELYKSLCLSDTQKCRADKIQNNFEFDTLSLREKIKCEEEALSQLMKKCACDSEVKAQKKKIKVLKKELKETCECYRDEFEELLSDKQEKQFKKLIKKKCDCDD